MKEMAGPRLTNWASYNGPFRQNSMLQ